MKEKYKPKALNEVCAMNLKLIQTVNHFQSITVLQCYTSVSGREAHCSKSNTIMSEPSLDESTATQRNDRHITNPHS